MAETPDLLDRQALRRVPGLSTELQDVTEVEYRQVRLERVVLVGVWTSGTLADAERSLAELARLAETAGSEVCDGLIQRRDKPDAGTYIGSGKVTELRELVTLVGADTVICDGELTPGQLGQLEKLVKVKVVDRTWLILDIFAQHARSREGKAQVSLAQMQYLLPRLRGWGESLSRQAGGRVAGGQGIGSRGPGETKIETDRRRVRESISRLRREIAGMAKARCAAAGCGALGGPRWLHELREVQPPEPDDRRGRPCGGRALRHAGSDRAQGLDPVGSAFHPRRHGGVRPAPAPPTGRGLPLDIGGGLGC
jgi:GTPase